MDPRRPESSKPPPGNRKAPSSAPIAGRRVKPLNYETFRSNIGDYAFSLPPHGVLTNIFRDNQRSSKN